MLTKATLRVILLGSLAIPLAACNEDGVDSSTAETTTVPADDTTGTATSGTLETGN